MSRPEPDMDAQRSVSPGTPAPRFRRAGPFVYVSGVGAQDEDAGDIRAQTRACITGIADILEEAGGRLENLVEVTTYLRRITDFAGYNEAYSKFFTEDGPARTTVAVDQLSSADALIEMRGVAYIAENTNA